MRLAAAEAGIHPLAVFKYVAKVYADRGHQYVDVVQALKRPIRTPAGELQPEDVPVLTQLPVGFPQGGGFFLSLPLALGDV